jgi:hypothetical protein
LTESRAEFTPPAQWNLFIPFHRGETFFIFCLTGADFTGG